MTPKEQGKNVTVAINNHPIGCSKAGSISFTTSTNDSTTKCSVDAVTGVMWSETTPNINSGQITGNGLQPLKTSAGADPYALMELANAQLKQLLVNVSWTSLDGQLGFYGQGWLTSVKSDSPFDGEVTFDYTIDFTGKVQTTPLS